VKRPHSHAAFFAFPPFHQRWGFTAVIPA
jgi:hypothetical protein